MLDFKTPRPRFSFDTMIASSAVIVVIAMQLKYSDCCIDGHDLPRRVTDYSVTKHEHANTTTLNGYHFRHRVKNSMKHNSVNGFRDVQDARCNITDNGTQVVVDCSWRRLFNVPNLPVNSYIIRLDHNQLEHILGNVFNGMTRLTSLNLANNPLMNIPNDLFKGLNKVERIDFGNTMLYLQEPPIDLKYLLSDLRELTELTLTFKPCIHHTMRKICNIERYMFTNANMISTIQILDVDTSILHSMGSTKNAGNTLKLTLRNKNTLCVLPLLGNKTMSHFPSLKELTIYTWVFGKYTHFEDNVLNDQIGLKEVNIFIRIFTGCGPNSHIADVLIHNITKSAAIASHLNQLTIKETGTCMRDPSDDADILASLKSSKSIKTITLKNIALQFRSIDPSGVFPTSVTHLNLRGNCLSGFDIHRMLAAYNRLEVLDARNQNLTACATGRYPIKYLYSLPQVVNFVSPSKLRELYVSHCIGQCELLLSSPRRHYPNLRYLELSWMGGCQIVPYPVQTFTFQNSPALEFLDLTGSKLSNIGLSVFRSFLHLKTLRLAGNVLGKMGPHLSDSLRNISSLNALNLSNNEIKEFKKDVFENMKTLRTIDLSHNYLNASLPSFMPLKSLLFLNISFNSIHYISSKTRHELDTVGRNRSLIIDVTGNPTWCSCETLDFLKWMLSSNFTIHIGTQICHGATARLGDLNGVVMSLRTTCSSNNTKSNIIITAVGSVASVLVVSLIVGGLIYRYRWKLRYLYFMAKFYFADTDPEYERLFEFDAFVSYSSDDFEIARNGSIANLEIVHNLKLLLHERDFKPGQRIGYNISVGIHSCRRTVVFLSENFLESNWCMYELNIAREEAMRSKRTVLLMVILEKSVVDKLSVDLVDLLRTVTYLEYPKNGTSNDQVAVFWSKLAESIVGR